MSRILRRHMPELFDVRPLPPDWLARFTVLPLDRPFVREPMGPVESLHDPLGGAPGSIEPPDLGFKPADGFPGAPQAAVPGAEPPPDALAFYLPFHLYPAEAAGVYILAEGVHYLAERIWRACGDVLPYRSATWLARLTLWAHEEFHASVEAFAARLEITHRAALYRGPFLEYFRSRVGTDECLEEALATAAGYLRALDVRRGEPAEWRDAVGEALLALFERMPPGYRRAGEFRARPDFLAARRAFQEDNHRFALPDLPTVHPDVWRADIGGFRSLGLPRARYLVRIGSPLWEALELPHGGV